MKPYAWDDSKKRIDWENTLIGWLVALMSISLTALVIYVVFAVFYSATSPQHTDLITEHDGCRVYRVRGGGNDTVYFTTCQGGTQWSVPSGKTRRTIRNNTTIKAEK